MLINNMLKVATGIFKITKPIIETVIDRAQNTMNERFIQDKYVSREEYDSLRMTVLKLQQNIHDKSENK